MWCAIRQTGCTVRVFALLLACLFCLPLPGATPRTVEFTGSAADLQALPDKVPEGVVACDTPVMIVEAGGVTLTDIEMHGNYDSVDQKNRAAFIQIRAGRFCVERRRFFDGTKDGVEAVNQRESTNVRIKGLTHDEGGKQ